MAKSKSATSSNNRRSMMFPKNIQLIVTHIVNNISQKYGNKTRVLWGGISYCCTLLDLARVKRLHILV
jgi:hypothetical protein